MFRLNFTILSVILCVYCIIICGHKLPKNNEIPNFIHICHKSDPKLNECVKKSIDELRPHMLTGIPELGVPICEPLIIPRVAIDQSAGAVNLNSEYTNITVYGPSKFELKSVRVDPVKNRFRMRLWFPEIRMIADYKIKGNILMMPLTGTGQCFGNYTDVDAVAAMKGDRVKRNGEEYLKVKDMFVEFNIGNASVHLTELFNGDPELGQVMNKFLNENWKTVAAEMRPALEDAISDILGEVANNIFDKYPIDQLIPE